MKIIGLTGGMGTGKSTVSAYLASKGCYIMDADKISRDMTKKGAAALDEIRQVFGEKYFDSRGNLNRKALGDLVFNNPKALEKLQNIITSKVIQCILDTIEALKKENFDGVAVIDAPLLFECGMEKIGDENWLITADIKKRIERIGARDGLTREQILSRINNQMPQKLQEQMSSVVFDNSGSIEELKEKIDFHLERIKKDKE